MEGDELDNASLLGQRGEAQTSVPASSPTPSLTSLRALVEDAPPALAAPPPSDVLAAELKRRRLLQNVALLAIALVAAVVSFFAQELHWTFAGGAVTAFVFYYVSQTYFIEPTEEEEKVMRAEEVKEFIVENARNWAAFDREKAALFAQHGNRWAYFQGGELVATAVTKAELTARQVSARGLADPFGDLHNARSLCCYAGPFLACRYRAEWSTSCAPGNRPPGSSMPCCVCTTTQTTTVLTSQ